MQVTAGAWRRHLRRWLSWGHHHLLDDLRDLLDLASAPLCGRLGEDLRDLLDLASAPLWCHLGEDLRDLLDLVLGADLRDLRDLAGDLLRRLFQI